MASRRALCAGLELGRNRSCRWQSWRIDSGAAALAAVQLYDQVGAMRLSMNREMIEIIIFVEHIKVGLVCCIKMIMLQGAHGG